MFHSRRTLMLGVAATAAAGVVLSGCTGGSGTGDPDTLTIFAPQAATNDLADNSFTTQVEEQLDTDISWDTTTFDGVGAAQKRQTIIASGDLPDVFMLISWVDQFKRPELLRLGEQGALVPLNDLIAEHAPNIQAAFEENPEYEAVATAPDGNIYGLPQWNDCFHCSYSTKIWMNQDWLQAVGKASPTTTTELTDVLTAFKTQDPNGNGRPDEIPLSGMAAEGYLVPTLLNAFQYTPGPAKPDNSPLILDDAGEVTFAATTDAYRQGLEYITSLYSAGLIDEAAFTQNYDGLLALGDNADAVIVGSAVTQHPGNLVSFDAPDDRNFKYAVTGPITGPEGVDAATYSFPSTPGAVFAITNAATEEEQVKAIELADYLFSTDGHIRGEFGVEGKQWAPAAEGDVALDDTLQPTFKVLPGDPDADPAAIMNDNWGPAAQIFSSAEFRNAQVQATDTGTVEGYERRLFDATQLYAGHEGDHVFPGWKVWPAEDQTDAISEQQTNLQNAVSQAELAFITGQQDVTSDAAWQAYLDQLDSLGLQEYVSTMTTLYEEQVG